MRLTENDIAPGFETPKQAHGYQEWDSTSATSKKQAEWISSEEESEDYEQDEELKQF